MPTIDRQEILDTLACEIGLRPVGAPGAAQIAPFLRVVHREPGAVVADFADQGATLVAGFVEAERLCCAGIGWDYTTKPHPRLRISAAEEQLDAIEAMFAQSLPA